MRLVWYRHLLDRHPYEFTSDTTLARAKPHLGLTMGAVPGPSRAQRCAIGVARHRNEIAGLSPGDEVLKHLKNAKAPGERAPGPC